MAHLFIFIVTPAKGPVAKPDIQRLRLLRFVRNDTETSFLSLRGAPIHRGDAAISTLATDPKAGVQILFCSLNNLISGCWFLAENRRFGVPPCSYQSWSAVTLLSYFDTSPKEIDQKDTIYTPNRRQNLHSIEIRGYSDRHPSSLGSLAL